MNIPQQTEAQAKKCKKCEYKQNYIDPKAFCYMFKSMVIGCKQFKENKP